LNDAPGFTKGTNQTVAEDAGAQTISSWATAISAAKARLQTPAEVLQHGRSYFDEVVGRVYERYQQLLGESNALDFDDLLMKTVQLLKKSPEILSRYQSRYLHLLVDEFQDTSRLQFLLDFEELFSDILV
jgi:DNA helicase-2/ATP-dependent DNA helicase PcrA